MSVQWVGEDVHIQPAGPARGTPQLPGSKSLANRYLACAALATGPMTLRGATLSDDVRAMLDGLAALGVPTDWHAPRREVLVTGTRGNITADEVDIDVGHAGTVMRFLTALSCLGFGRRRLDGSERMRARPIGALVDGLVQMGAQLGYEAAEGYPPVTVVARGLGGGDVVFDTPPSSQFLSAVLMVAPYAMRDVRIRVEGSLPSRPYVDMTLDVMRSLGVEVVADDDLRRLIVPALQRYQGGTQLIEPDASAATYFWAAAAITGGRVRVEGLTRDSRQGDVHFVDVLERMGCAVDEDEQSLTVSGPKLGALRGVDVDLNAMPDTVQTLAVAALFAEGLTTIRNVANLRIKETDRIAALVAELAKLGATVQATDDRLTIEPPRKLQPAALDTYDDHRMAMSLALVGLVANGIAIRDARCVAKSFPDYFAELAKLGG